jgi:hypothetical protein
MVWLPRIEVPRSHTIQENITPSPSSIWASKWTEVLRGTFTWLEFSVRPRIGAKTATATAVWFKLTWLFPVRVTLKTPDWL